MGDNAVTDEQPETSDIITEREAAALLRVSPVTLRNWRSQKVGPPFIRLTKRCPRYLRSQVNAWIASRAVAPSSAVTPES